MTSHHWHSISGLRFTAIDVQAHLRQRRSRYAWAYIKSSISSIVGRTRASDAVSSSVLLTFGLTAFTTQLFT
jgi:hypothetical protein